MNEITRIHLAATPYNIEVTAKKELEKYLAAIVKVLTTDDDAQREIEARMVELLMERGVTGDKVITVADVQALRDTLGKPGDFAETTGSLAPDAAKKRLMRDSEAGMLGGVLAGMAAYTGVDVVWWRIVTVVLALASFGTVVLLYAVLWVVMPRAQTATERLQMRGIEPTLEHIQAEAAREVRDTPVQQKFLVVLLRIVGVLSLLGAALLASVIVGAGVMYMISIWSTDGWLLNAWIVGAAVSGVVSGVLFVVLMLLGVYSFAAWKMTKKMTIMASIIVVFGLLTCGVAVATVTYGANLAHQSLAEHTKTQRTDLSTQLSGVKQLRIKGAGPSVTYHSTSSQPYAEVQSIDRPGEQKVRLMVDRQGETAVLRLEGLSDARRCSIWGCGRDGFAAITVYGPALEYVDLDGSSVQYQDANQDTLSVETRNNASFDLSGKVRELHAKTSENSQVGASDAAVDRAVIELTDSNSTVDLGVVQQLMLTAPKSCASAGERTVNYARADAITLNGSPVTGTEDIPCLTLHREPTDAR